MTSEKHAIFYFCSHNPKLSFFTLNGLTHYNLLEYIKLEFTHGQPARKEAKNIFTVFHNHMKAEYKPGYRYSDYAFYKSTTQHRTCEVKIYSFFFQTLSTWIA